MAGRNLGRKRTVVALIAAIAGVELLYYRVYLAIKDLDSVLPPGDRAIFNARADLRHCILAAALPMVIVGIAYFGSLVGVLASKRGDDGRAGP